MRTRPEGAGGELECLAYPHRGECLVILHRPAEGIHHLGEERVRLEPCAQDTRRQLVHGVATKPTA